MTLKKGSIPKFIERRAHDLVMFGWVDAYRVNFPEIPTLTALQHYADRYKLSAEEFDIESGRRAYQRMLHEIQDYKKQKLNE
jgi:hypothetical protein